MNRREVLDQAQRDLRELCEGMSRAEALGALQCSLRGYAGNDGHTWLLLITFNALLIPVAANGEPCDHGACEAVIATFNRASLALRTAGADG